MLICSIILATFIVIFVPDFILTVEYSNNTMSNNVTNYSNLFK